MRITCVTFDAKDPAAIAGFWAEALGWEVSLLDDGIALCTSPGSDDLYLEFVPVPEPKAVKNRVHLGTAVVELDTEVARLCALGATVAYEEELDEPGVRNIVLRDPEGNEFCLGSRTFAA